MDFSKSKNIKLKKEIKGVWLFKKRRRSLQNKLNSRVNIHKMYSLKESKKYRIKRRKLHIYVILIKGEESV